MCMLNWICCEAFEGGFIPLGSENAKLSFKELKAKVGN